MVFLVIIGAALAISLVYEVFGFCGKSFKNKNRFSNIFGDIDRYTEAGQSKGRSADLVNRRIKKGLKEIESSCFLSLF